MRNFIVSLLFFSSLFFSQTGIKKLTYYDSLKAKIITEKLTLREKCAQMVFPHGFAYDASDTSSEMQRLENLVKDEKVGGVLFLTGKIDELPVAINKLQKLSEVPLIIATDFENGTGGRMEGGIEFPPPMGIAATGDTSLAFQSGFIQAKEMRANGVTQNFAPVLDINSNYKNPIINYRSFSDDKQTVVKFGLSYIRGLTSGGVFATAKHFPGHGGTDLDSHNELPLITKSLEKLSTSDIYPFAKAIKSGLPAIMIAHLNVPSITSNDTLPVTLSHKAVTDFLKNKLHFAGLCISDAMNMHAITKTYGDSIAVQMAVNAGIDVVLFPVNVQRAINSIYDGVLFGTIEESRVDDAVYKIILAKMKLGLFKSKTININDALKIAKSKKDKRFALKVAERSITLLKNSESLIPIDKKKYKNPVLVILRQTDRKDFLEKQRPFADFVNARMKNLKTIELSKLSNKKDFRSALKLCKKSDLILLATFISVQSFSGEIELDSAFTLFAKKILRLHKPVVMLNFGNPYVPHSLQRAKNIITAYGICDVCEAAATEALFGEINISGKLPIEIPGVAKRNSGINYTRDFLAFQSVNEDSLYDFSKVDSLMNDAIKRKVFPGAQLIIGKNGKVILNNCYGHFTYSKSSPRVKPNTMYDLASLTKVIATTTATMLLYERGKLSLKDKVAKYLPEFANNGKDEITIEQLLLHTSGLRAGRKFYKKFRKRSEIINEIMHEKLINKPGEKFVYSDLGMIVLQQVIEKITGESLEKFVYDNVFSKLNLSHIMFNPPKNLRKFCAPTEKDNYWRKRLVQGTVHDETAALLGGVSGNAGLFSNAHDVAVFVQMLLDGGVYKGKRILKQSTIDLFTSRKANDRAYGWDTKSEHGYTSAGKLFSLNSFGHTGFTGTSIWVDKDRKLFVVLLSNRVYPTRKNRKHIKFRPILHDAVVEAIQ